MPAAGSSASVLASVNLRLSSSSARIWPSNSSRATVSNCRDDISARIVSPFLASNVQQSSYLPSKTVSPICSLRRPGPRRRRSQRRQRALASRPWIGARGGTPAAPRAREFAERWHRCRPGPRRRRSQRRQRALASRPWIGARGGTPAAPRAREFAERWHRWPPRLSGCRRAAGARGCSGVAVPRRRPGGRGGHRAGGLSHRRTASEASSPARRTREARRGHRRSLGGVVQETTGPEGGSPALPGSRPHGLADGGSTVASTGPVMTAPAPESFTGRTRA